VVGMALHMLVYPALFFSLRHICTCTRTGSSSFSLPTWIACFVDSLARPSICLLYAFCMPAHRHVQDEEDKNNFSQRETEEKARQPKTKPSAMAQTRHTARHL
jgi:phytoene/squalene synthetase